MKQSLWVILALLLPFCGCSQNDPVSGSSEKPNNYTDSLVYSTDDYSLYLCRHEWTNIVLSVTDPATIDLGRYRIPTKDEAYILHTLYIPSTTEQRYLCVAPDGYYTFKLIKGSSITKAGYKTKYAIRPVRIVHNPKDTIIQL